MASVDEVWLVDFGDPFPGEPAHHRPAVVLGPPATFGADLPFVILCPTTTTLRKLSVHVEIEPSPSNGLDETSYVQCESIRSVSSRRLVHRLGMIDVAASDRIHDVVRMLLDH